MRPLLPLLIVLVAPLLGLVLVDDGGAPGPASTPAGPVVAPARRPAAVALAPAPRAATSIEPAPAPPASSLEDLLEELLEAADEEGPLDPGDLARLEAAWTDGALDLPLRAGALRAVLERGGREALARAVDAFDRPEVAPLREVLAFAAAKGAGPGDAALVERLLDRADAARDGDARLLASVAAVRAGRRALDPVRLGPALEARLARALDELARSAPSPDAAEALAALRTPAALDALEALCRTAPDEERRLEAALALAHADPTRGAAALAALAPTLTDPLLRDRLARATEAP